MGTTADAVRSAQRAVRVVNRLRRLGHQVQVRATADDGDCAAHSYGQVQAYLRAHPCVSLHRALLEVSSKDAGTVLIAIAWVRMPDQPTAAELKALLDRYGTGNVTELSRESGRYRRIRFTGRAYASWLDGDTVANAQAEPVAPGALGRKLTEIATNSVR